MKFTRSSLKSHALHGVVGLTAGVLYSLVSDYLSQRGIGNDIGVETDALQSNVELYSLFQQLKPFSTISKKMNAAFLRAVALADELVLLDKQLSEKRITPKVADRMNASSLFEECTDRQLAKMVTIAKQKSTSENEVRVHKLYGKIHGVLLAHLTSIVRLTERAQL